MRALISVSDKRGILDFSEILLSLGFEIISTGGTSEYLTNNKIPVVDISEITSFPEILEGRVKTLHPKIHGGILAKRNKKLHLKEINELGIVGIDIVVNNLYPFQETISDKDVLFQEALENIDIGGPAMTRAAAKNFEDVLIIVDPEDYDNVGKILISGKVDYKLRCYLASKAFRHTAFYDTLVANFLSNTDTNLKFPNYITSGWELEKIPRYGENPHQKSAVYKSPNETGGIVNAEKLHGIEMSYLNYFDADAAWIASNLFDEQCVSIIKHGNPCGLSVNYDQTEAYKRAVKGDPISAFGGIVGFNKEVTESTANEMRDHFIDVIVAPSYEKNALEIFKKRKRTRILQVSQNKLSSLMFRSVSGGILVQEFDPNNDSSENWDVVTKKKPNKKIFDDLEFSWKISSLIKSNAIVVAKDRTILGMGAGQPNRLNSVKLATSSLEKNYYQDSVLASDAFFPFPDNLISAREKGIKSFIQPGGSIKDQEIINVANELGLIMVFTHTRHFLH